MLPDNSAFGALPRFCRPLTPSDRFLRRAGDVAGYAFVPRAEAHGAVGVNRVATALLRTTAAGGPQPAP